MNDRAVVDAEAAQPVDTGEIVVARQVYPDRLPILALPSRPLFPKVVAPLALINPRALAAVQAATESEAKLVGLVFAKDDEDPPALHGVGVVAQILKLNHDEQSGAMRLLAGALDRFRVVNLTSSDPYLAATVMYLYEPTEKPDDELRAYALAVINALKELVQLNPLFKDELSLMLSSGSVEEPGRLADYAAFLTSAAGTDLQAVLETLDLKERLDKVLGLLERETEISRLQTRIRQQIEERVTKQQREFFLREQLKEIRKELGLEKDEKEAELSRLKERLEELSPSEEAKKRIDDELNKLSLLEPMSPEFGVTRNYLDWLTSLPWGVSSSEKVTLDSARKVLDRDHYGLSDVKDRILELIAAGLLRGNFGGSILCLVGPPGVGKTSIGRSIASALGRKFYRFSLGGMQDEAEIKGHRRTYIGAMPGKFLQAMRVTGTDNPVLMLDEIDKVGASYRGDPASALLEALDPEQNSEFLDHYLDVRFDLSKVLFVCTANQLDTIPGPLLDRMEVIRLGGYVQEEKLQIAKRYLVPKAIEHNGLLRKNVTLTVAALREVIEGYAREAGVRSLEQAIGKIMRKVAVKVLDNRGRKVKVDKKDVVELLGPPRFRDEALEEPRPGVITGLAWTPHGGDTLSIEAAAVVSERSGFKQTGQLGKVMIESSEIAYTLARLECGEHSGDCAGFFDRHFVHLHVPAGATPKDGPSAGVTIASALYTLARGKPAKAGWAMTGELDLTGRVLPVGGIREKVIAARRAKLKNVILPEENRGDWERLPDHLKKGLRAHFAARFEDVVELCL